MRCIVHVIQIWIGLNHTLTILTFVSLPSISAGAYIRGSASPTMLAWRVADSCMFACETQSCNYVLLVPLYYGLGYISVWTTKLNNIVHIYILASYICSFHKCPRRLQNSEIHLTCFTSSSTPASFTYTTSWWSAVSPIQTPTWWKADSYKVTNEINSSALNLNAMKVYKSNHFDSGFPPIH